MFFRVRIFLLLAAITTCSGCGTKQFFSGFVSGDIDNAEPPAKLVDFVKATEINSLWRETVGTGSGEFFIKLVPATLNNKIFVADASGNITGLYADTGALVWHNETELPITGGPGVNDDAVIIGTADAEVICFSSETGEFRWRSPVSSEVLSSPETKDGIVVVRTIDGKVFALDLNNGKRLWVYERTVPALTLRGTSTPVIIGDLVIVGFDGGRLTALALKTGKLVWESKVAVPRGRSELERMVDIDAQPLVVGDVIYITTFQVNVTAVALYSGQILWQREVSSYSELAADETNLYVTSADGHVWALDRFSGATIWKQEALAHRKVTGPEIFNDRIVVGDLQGYVHWLDKDTGVISGRIQVGEKPIMIQPITYQDKLFSYTSEGQLAAFSYTAIEPEGLPLEVTEKEVTAEKRPPKTPEKHGKSIFGHVLDIFGF